MINAIFEGIFLGSVYTLCFVFTLAMLHVPLFGPALAYAVLEKWNIISLTGEAFWGFCIVVWAYQFCFFYQLTKRVD